MQNIEANYRIMNISDITPLAMNHKDITTCEEWAKRLWHDAEDLWIRRDGQDHYYRTDVILPAFKQQLTDFIRFKSIIDFGCGDGYMLELLLQSAGFPFDAYSSVVLIDRSNAQLQLAYQRLTTLSPHVIAINAEFDSLDINQFAHTPSPKLLLSIFVMDELISLSPYLSVIKQCINDDDLLIAVVINSHFAETLSAAHPKMERLFYNLSFPEKDWQWAAQYPIPTALGTIYLPYFYRGLSDYQRSFCRRFQLDSRMRLTAS